MIRTKQLRYLDLLIDDILANETPEAIEEWLIERRKNHRKANCTHDFQPIEGNEHYKQCVKCGAYYE